MAHDPWADVLQWMLAGTLAWQALLFWLFTLLWYAAALPGQRPKGLDQPGTWLGLAALQAATGVVLYAQRRLLSSSDVAPVQLRAAGLTGQSWPSLFLSRCLLRNRRWGDGADLALFYGSCIACGVLGCYLLAPSTTPPAAAAAASGGGVLALYGAVLGAWYAVVYLIRAKTMLSYPILHRPRFFRIKLRLRSVARSSIINATLALLAAVLAAPGLSLPAPWSAPAAWLGAWRGGLLLAGLWAAGAAVLEVVFTETVDVSSLDLAHSSSTTSSSGSSGRELALGGVAVFGRSQDWALRDLASLATSSSPAAAARRAAIFADDTGAAGWTPLVRYCLAEVEEAARLVAAATPTAEGGGSGGPGGSGPRWNVVRVAAAVGGARSPAQDLATWHLQSRYYRLTWCVQALAGLAAASLVEDRCGVAQLSTPGLGGVLGALLGLAAGLGAYNKRVAASCPSSPPGRLGRLVAPLVRLLLPGQHGARGGGLGGQQVPHVDVAAAALLDTTKLGVYRLCHTFGRVLLAVLRQSGGKPLPGSSAQEVEALLQSFLAEQE